MINFETEFLNRILFLLLGSYVVCICVCVCISRSVRCVVVKKIYHHHRNHCEVRKGIEEEGAKRGKRTCLRWESPIRNLPLNSFPSADDVFFCCCYYCCCYCCIIIARDKTGYYSHTQYNAHILTLFTTSLILLSSSLPHVSFHTWT